MKFLKLHFITAKIREKGYICMNSAGTCAEILLAFTLIQTRKETYSIYQLIQNESHGITSVLSFLLYSCITAGMIWDYCLYSFLVMNTIYPSIVSMKFWIQKIWFVDIWLKIIHENWRMQYFDLLWFSNCEMQWFNFTASFGQNQNLNRWGKH